MEPHKHLPPGIEEFRPDEADGPEAYYAKARAFALKFYPDEVLRISSVVWDEITPKFFFEEYVWVVHATGFSAKAVGRFMPKLVEAYGPWHQLGTENFEVAFARVKEVCNNRAKSLAVWHTAQMMVTELIERDAHWDAFENWKAFRLQRLSTVDQLAELPYIGKVTRYHLGRNIGLLDCVKPDLHLIRLAKYWGFLDCTAMCECMRGNNDVPLGIVDLFVWYAASTFGTTHLRVPGDR